MKKLLSVFTLCLFLSCTPFSVAQEAKKKSSTKAENFQKSEEQSPELWCWRGQAIFGKAVGQRMAVDLGVCTDSEEMCESSRLSLTNGWEVAAEDYQLSDCTKFENGQ